MAECPQVWSDGWQDRLYTTVKQAGIGSVTEFLHSKPSESYVAMAVLLGNDVAALQLEWLHYLEANTPALIRIAAMDSLVRDLKASLINGWPQDSKGDFWTAFALARWQMRIKQKDSNLESWAVAVLKTLDELSPPVGWLPTGPTDSIISTAFGKAWPKEE